MRTDELDTICCPVTLEPMRQCSENANAAKAIFTESAKNNGVIVRVKTDPQKPNAYTYYYTTQQTLSKLKEYLITHHAGISRFIFSFIKISDLNKNQQASLLRSRDFSQLDWNNVFWQDSSFIVLPQTTQPIDALSAARQGGAQDAILNSLLQYQHAFQELQIAKTRINNNEAKLCGLLLEQAKRGNWNSVEASIDSLGKCMHQAGASTFDGVPLHFFTAKLLPYALQQRNEKAVAFIMRWGDAFKCEVSSVVRGLLLELAERGDALSWKCVAECIENTMGKDDKTFNSRLLQHALRQDNTGAIIFLRRHGATGVLRAPVHGGLFVANTASEVATQPCERSHTTPQCSASCVIA